MSPWKQAAERFKAAQAAKAAPAPAGPLAAEARASVALDGETRSMEAGDNAGLDLEPVQPAAAEAPKRTRGRPPGAKNKPKAAGSAESNVEAAVDAINANLEAFCAGVRPPFTEAGVAELRGGGIISEAAARSLLNGPPPNGVSPAAAQAMVNALVDPGVDAALETASEQAGAHAAACLQHAPDPRAEPARDVLYDVGFRHYPDGAGGPSADVTLRVPRHRVAAATLALDSFVAAVFPSPSPSGAKP